MTRIMKGTQNVKRLWKLCRQPRKKESCFSIPDCLPQGSVKKVLYIC